MTYDAPVIFIKCVFLILRKNDQNILKKYKITINLKIPTTKFRNFKTTISIYKGSQNELAK